MNKKIYKLVALGTTVGMLTGCGNTVETKESVQNSEVKESTVEQSVEESQVESPYPEYLNMESYRPIVKEGEEITLKVAVGMTATLDHPLEENWFVQFIEQELNINLEIEEVNANSRDERKGLMLASNDLPDLMINMGMGTTDVVQYGVDGGQFLAISDYFSEELTPNILKVLAENEAAKAESTAPDGKIYIAPSISQDSPGWGSMIGTNRVFIDTTYMEKAGISEVPTTLDGFVDMLRAMKAIDPAEMGVDEIWPLVGNYSYDLQYLQNAFGWIPNSYTDLTVPAWDCETDSIVIPVMQEEKYSEYVKLLNTLYTEGLLHPDMYTMDRTAIRALFAEGKVGVLCDSAPYVSRPDNWNVYTGAIPLSSQWSEDAVTTRGNNFSRGYVVVAADTEYPELCLRLIDYLYTDEGTVYSRKGPAAGSEDTLGLVGGFELDETGTKTQYVDVVAGKYATDLEYQEGQVWLCNYLHENGRSDLIALEMLGIENASYAPLDTSEPDPNYRSLCYEAQKDYWEYKLPSMYISADVLEEYTDYHTLLHNYEMEETAKFVTGKRPLSELPDFFEEMKEIGMEEFYEICLSCYATYERVESK